MGASGSDFQGFGSSVALSFVSLAIVCLIAYILLRWLGRRGLGRSDVSVRIIGRCYLEPRRSVYIIEAGSRYFLIGVSDGPMSLLAELDKASLPTPEDGGKKVTASFAEVLARMLGRRGR
jgi:flagellar biosynthetic protein FliO